MLNEAEQAVRDGDYGRADRHLREALRLQEDTLGPTHVQLASTLNNLAVVAETLGNLRDAEQFFRRAYAIASESLPAADPLVTTSFQNLKDFCDARGLPLEDWPGILQESHGRAAGPANAGLAAPGPGPCRRRPGRRPAATAGRRAGRGRVPRHRHRAGWRPSRHRG
ncbi:MAG: tetratricopeptide repeat protein [Vicinamibacterales bacterium]